MISCQVVAFDDTAGGQEGRGAPQHLGLALDAHAPRPCPSQVLPSWGLQHLKPVITEHWPIPRLHTLHGQYTREHLSRQARTDAPVKLIAICLQ